MKKLFLSWKQFWVFWSGMVLGIVLTLSMTIYSESKSHELSYLPDGKWEIVEMVKGFDSRTGTPVYWAIGQEIRKRNVHGYLLDIHVGDYKLLTFPREQIGDPPDDRSIDPRVESRTMTLEVKDGYGTLTVARSKNST